MDILRSLAALVVMASSALVAVGCAPPGDVGTGEEDVSEAEDAAVAFQVLDVQKSESPAGLTVIKSKAAYREFFGAEPPQGVSFNAHWVLHASMGVQMTGGFGIEITSIEKVGNGSSRRLVVATENTSPGFGCMVTMALTNPQTTVRINKHTGAKVEGAAEDVAVDCEDPNDSFCARVRCAKGSECSEEERACVPTSCNPDLAWPESDCGTGQACRNMIQCIQAPCPEDYRCYADPCEGLTYEGSCRGDAASWCEDGAIKSVTCEPGTCGIDPDTQLSDCL